MVEEDGSDIVQVTVQCQEATPRLVRPDLDLVVIAAGDEPARLSMWLCKASYYRMLTMAASCGSQFLGQVHRAPRIGL